MMSNQALVPVHCPKYGHPVCGWKEELKGGNKINMFQLIVKLEVKLRALNIYK